MNKTTDIVLPNGTVIPDASRRVATEAAAAAPSTTATPWRIRAAFLTSLVLLVSGAAYRLGDAFNPGQPWRADPLVSWAWTAVQAGTLGLVATAAAWLVWRVGRRS